jgi:acyl-CoA reductase-like NAD-dependent aldehyde dehydrogenase
LGFSSLLKKTPIKFTDLFINNEFIKSVSGRTLSVIDPSTEKEICQIAEATAEDGKIAVK